jgi:hypothetical protein
MKTQLIINALVLLVMVSLLQSCGKSKGFNSETKEEKEIISISLTALVDRSSGKRVSLSDSQEFDKLMSFNVPSQVMLIDGNANDIQWANLLADDIKLCYQQDMGEMTYSLRHAVVASDSCNNPLEPFDVDRLEAKSFTFTVENDTKDSTDIKSRVKTVANIALELE